ncbi:MAG: HupE/UreJ family protein [Flavobacteriaceae bacterium]|nr:HupE/UreJ family protein [Flavobacteriaceae bacterium]
MSDQFLFYFKQGLFHVLDWSAYDHILFLVALVVVFTLKDWKKTLWLITFFTIGHTLTLALAAYDLIYVKENIVEFAIVVTIFITSLSNLIFQKKNAGSLNLNIVFALVFGLIHGLGFSSYFKILVGREAGKVLPLISFASGVEVSQAILVIVLLGLSFIGLNIFRISKRDWVTIISAIILGITIPILYSRKFW